MPLFEVAILKKKTEHSPETLMNPGIFPMLAENKEQARDRALLCDSSSFIASTDISHYEVLVRPFV